MDALDVRKNEISESEGWEQTDFAQFIGFDSVADFKRSILGRVNLLQGPDIYKIKGETEEYLTVMGVANIYDGCMGLSNGTQVRQRIRDLTGFGIKPWKEKKIIRKATPVAEAKLSTHPKIKEILELEQRADKLELEINVAKISGKLMEPEASKKTYKLKSVRREFMILQYERKIAEAAAKLNREKTRERKFVEIAKGYLSVADLHEIWEQVDREIQ